jgi:prepilin-type N-terminal cleavage/methylation domain-containing protein
MKRSAFTLIELLVVIVVIALLAAMVIPAINGAREAARRGQCISRQRDLAAALIAHDKATNGLPGCLNQLGTTPIHSWAVAIFLLIGENKRYELLMKNDPAQALVPLPALLCPSDNPSEKGRLNYVVNCGPTEDVSSNTNIINGDIAPAFTLFKDRRASLISVNKKVKIEDIPNGASNTILLSENVDADSWHQPWSSNWNSPTTWVTELPTTMTPPLYTRDQFAVKNLGFVWSQYRQEFAPNSSESVPRPSSKHPATVIVAYADGTAKPMSDDVDMKIYLKAVCVDSEKATLPITEGGLGLDLKL